MSNIIFSDKTYDFAVIIVKLSLKLVSEIKEYVFSKQILRSETSIGVNTEETIGGISKKNMDQYFVKTEEIIKTLYEIINSSKKQSLQ